MKLKLLLQALFISSFSYVVYAIAPTANPQSLVAVQSNTTQITLSGNGTGALTYNLTSLHTSKNGMLLNFDSSKGTVSYKSLSTFLGQDTFTFTVTDSSGIESSPATVYIQVLPPSDRAYISNQDSSGNSQIGIIAGVGTSQPFSDGTIGSLSPADGQIYDMVASPDGTRVYLCYYNSATSVSKIAIIDTASNTKIGYVSDPSGNLQKPIAMAISPDGTLGYICNANQNTISILNVQTSQIASSNVTNPYVYNIVNPCAIAFTPDGKRAYVACNGGLVPSGVYMIDVATNTITVHVSQWGGSGLLNDIVITSDGNTGYVVVGADDGRVWIFNTNSNEFIGTLRSETGSSASIPQSNAMAVSADGSFQYIVYGSIQDFISNTSGVLFATGGTVLASVDDFSYTFNQPYSIAFTTDGTKAYVVNKGGGEVSIITVPPSPSQFTPGAVTGTVLGYISPEYLVFLGVAPPVAHSPAQQYCGENSSGITIPLTGSGGIGSSLQFLKVSGPSYGSVSGFPLGFINKNNGIATCNVTYTPNPSTTNTRDTFTFQVYDGSQHSSSASVLITIDSPTAQNQSVIFPEGSQQNAITLVGTDEQPGTLIYSKVSDPSHGSVSVSPNGQATYTTNSSTFTGHDSFQFTVTNGTTGIISAPATVSIRVNNSGGLAAHFTSVFTADLIAKYSGM